MLVSFFNIYAQEIPEEFYTDFKIFEKQSSNKELLVSIDKWTYQLGDFIQFSGYAIDTTFGERIYINNGQGDICGR